MNRVVITGAGVVSPVGTGREEFWCRLTSGYSGIGPVTLFDASTFPVKIGGEVKNFDDSKVLNRFPRMAQIRDRKAFLALEAAEEAVADSLLDPKEFREAAVWIGVGLESINLEDLTPFADANDLGEALAASIAECGATRWTQTPLDTIAVMLGERYSFAAGRYVNCSACAAGAQVIGDAWRMLRAGRAEIALAGSADSMLNPLGLGGFSLLRVLAAENDRPQNACRPFDVTRQGTVLGEGAGFVVLETLEHAMSRSARIYAEILGYGSAMDAYAASDPDPNGRGAVLSMTRALKCGNLRPEDVDCVNSHGTGTPKNDVMETAAIKETLGARAYNIPIHAIKSMTGHMIAASGSVETIAAALTVSRGVVPPTMNLHQPDPECDLDYVPNVARPFSGDTVLTNSFGFGGQNASLVIRRFEG